MEEQFQEFEEMLKVHDWWYVYSDDHSVWQRGNKAEGAIDKKFNECLALDENRTRALYIHYNPRIKKYRVKK